jgi:sugar phosphate isomerase/epimerase
MAERNKLMFPPTRIGATSWVINGSLSDNLRRISSDVSDMEIVLFDTEEQSNMPSEEEVSELRRLCGELDITCTVHFPVDVCASSDAAQRRDCEDKCMRTAELFAPLDPFAWILHLVGGTRGRTPDSDIAKWREESRKSAGRIASVINDKRRLCVETLDYDFTFVEDIVEDLGLSVCLDVGHLVRFGYPVRRNIKKYMPHTRVVHVHGVKPDGTDHVDLSYFDSGLLSETIELMSDGCERVMTMEVFEDDYERSVSVLRKISGARCSQRF